MITMRRGLWDGEQLRFLIDVLGATGVLKNAWDRVLTQVSKLGRKEWPMAIKRKFETPGNHSRLAVVAVTVILGLVLVKTGHHPRVQGA